MAEDEQQFRTVVEATPNAIVAVDEAGRIVLVNPSAVDIFGYSKDELVGQPLEMLMPERFRAQHAVFRANYFANPSPRPMGVGRELAGRRKDGSEFPVEIGLSFTHTQQGPLALAFITDITIRKYTEAELNRLLVREQAARAESEAARGRFSFLAEASALLSSSLDYRRTLDNVTQLAVPRIADWCAVDVLNDEGQFDRLSVAHIDTEKIALAQQLQRRYPPDPDAAFGLYHVVRTGEPELYAEMPDSLLEDVAQDDEHLQILRELAFESGMIVPLSLRGTTFGAITFVSTQHERTYSADDLTMASELAQRAALSIDNALLYREAQQLNAELERRVHDRTAQLEAANRELEAFSYSVSHDLRAPLRALDGFSQALIEDYYDIIDGEGKEYLQLLRTESQRMGQLIDALLSLSRYTRVEITHQQIDLSSMARAIAHELQRQAPARQADFTIEPDVTGYGDADLMRAVLQNLLGNAWKYTAEQPRAQIAFGVTDVTGQMEYYVRDNGVGFNMDYVHKLFGPFQRLHAAHEFEGTGIGLATVQRIIRRHRGTVRAEGAVGEGATFYFTLGTGAHHHEQDFAG